MKHSWLCTDSELTGSWGSCHATQNCSLLPAKVSGSKYSSLTATSAVSLCYIDRLTETLCVFVFFCRVSLKSVAHLQKFPITHTGISNWPHRSLSEDSEDRNILRRDSRSQSLRAQIVWNVDACTWVSCPRFHYHQRRKSGKCRT